MTEHCHACRYFTAGTVMGTCRRYPAVQNKHVNDWCGEYQPVIERKKPGRKPKNVPDTPIA